MTSIYKIQPKHLNEHSSLYGGQLLEWIDNYCLAKTETYRYKIGEKFVTRTMNCQFLNPAYLGDLITMRIKKEKIGKTSINFDFEVSSKGIIIAQGETTFVKMFGDKKIKIIKTPK